MLSQWASHLSATRCSTRQVPCSALPVPARAPAPPRPSSAASAACALPLAAMFLQYVVRVAPKPILGQCQYVRNYPLMGCPNQGQLPQLWA